ncbi:MAG: bifunctional UDP-N-acetylglucosamine diphosphorylase/glucosamine-1-phosphate N-acetyltransferase GlmU [Alphaproteobacteria bacterium]|nr:bifunctional UDP-N-acetylglucosamine diphosphorylase/glucosamine-1-phosphate N-acetyltransferase GlmU [Alphaproteobacteria bacterium]
MSLACIILAAGQGTRMCSDLPKVMHSVAGWPMVKHVVSICESLAADQIIPVIAPDMIDVREAVRPYACVVQATPNGTGDAVKAARKSLQEFSGNIVVLFGDTPLLTTQALQQLIDRQKETGAAIVVGGFVPSDAGAYGRLIVRADGQLDAIIEAADASPEQKAIKLCNGGIMLFQSDKLWPMLDQLRNDNAKGEFYLTDCVEMAAKAGHKVAVTEMPVDDVMGINTRAHLAKAEKIMQDRLRQRHMLAGITMTDPDTVFLSVDTIIGKDVTIGPNVIFGAGVVIDSNVVIHPFCHLEKVSVGKGAVVGPFARLRPGSTIGEGAHIGNFVEIKKSAIAAGSKINHLSYIGDATVGEKTNIGAGTITCNYDGFNKSLTQIGAAVFVGSNTSLVAPVRIGDGALIAAGSTITRDVPENALAIARERQRIVEGKAKTFRSFQEQIKKAKEHT